MAKTCRKSETGGGALRRDGHAKFTVAAYQMRHGETAWSLSVHLRLATSDAMVPEQLINPIEELVVDQFGSIQALVNELVAGTTDVF